LVRKNHNEINDIWRSKRDCRRTFSTFASRSRLAEGGLEVIGEELHEVVLSQTLLVDRRRLRGRPSSRPDSARLPSSPLQLCLTEEGQRLPPINAEFCDKTRVHDFGQPSYLTRLNGHCSRFAKCVSEVIRERLKEVRQRRPIICPDERVDRHAGHHGNFAQLFQHLSIHGNFSPEVVHACSLI